MKISFTEFFRKIKFRKAGIIPMAKMLYEGKAKKIYETENPNEILVYYKDDATALNGLKKGTIIDKGIMNNTITTFFFDLLGKNGIPHHQIKKLSDREALCKKVHIIPIEVVTRNIAAGSLAKKMGVEEGSTVIIGGFAFVLKE